jgi:ketosteroid isomerase-like protein
VRLSLIKILPGSKSRDNLNAAPSGGLPMLRLKTPRIITSASLAALIFLSIPVGAKQRSESPAVREIRAVLDRQVAAWNRRDIEGFMAGYWRSPDLTFYSGGTETKGWQGTIDRYRASYLSEGREMGQLTFSDLRIEVLGKDSAFVRGRWQLKMSNTSPGGLFTLIFRKFSDGWKIVHDHTGATS